MFVLIPPQRYVEGLSHSWFSGSYVDYYLRILRLDYFNYFDLSFNFLGHYGTHLWFIGLLFVFSLVALPLFLYLKRETGQRFILKVSAISEKWGGVLLFIATSSMAVILMIYALLIRPINPIRFLFGMRLEGTECL